MHTNAWEERVCGRIRKAHSALREKISPIKGKKSRSYRVGITCSHMIKTSWVTCPLTSFL